MDFKQLQQKIKDEVIAVFANIVQAIKEMRRATVEDFKNINAKIDVVAHEIESKADEAIRIAKENAQKKGDPGHTPTTEELTAIMVPLIPAPIPGNDAVITEDIKKEIAGMIEVPVVLKTTERIVVEKPVEIAKYETGPEILNKIADLLAGYGIAFRDGLELLIGDERLEFSAIKGSEEILAKIEQKNQTKVIGGQQGLRVYVDNAKKGLLKVVNYKAGTGVTITHSVVNGIDTITFNQDTSTLTLPSGANPTVTALGRAAIDTTDNQLLIGDGANAMVMAVKKRSMTFVLDTPTAADVFPIWQAPYNVTITKITATVRGGTSVTFNVDKRASNSLASAGTSALTSSLVATTTGANSTTFSSAGIASGEFLVFVASALSGTVNQIVVEVDFTIDRT